MRTFVRQNTDREWEVWIDLEDDNNRPGHEMSLCVGVGATRDEAVADAVQDLEGVIDTLQGPPEGL